MLAHSKIAEGRGKLTVHVGQCEGRQRHLAPTQMIMEDLGSTEDRVDYGPHKSPSSQNLPLKLVTDASEEKQGVSGASGTADWTAER